MDRLIALVALRWKLESRAVRGRGWGALAVAAAVVALAMFSLATSLVAFLLPRTLARTHPQLLLPVLSALAALAGLSWAFSPLLAGVMATETHDLTRLLHYPVPVSTLIASSLLANVLQPMVLAQLLPLAALAVGLGGAGPRALVAFVGLLLSLALALAAGQLVGLALHAVARHRRWHDRAMLAGIALGLLVSVVPLLLLGAGGAPVRRLAMTLVVDDVFAALPFAWGARAAVYAGRGEPLAFLGWAIAAALAVAAALALSTVIAQRLYRGELVLGEAPRATGPARIRLPGRIGALVEKDLRVTWRDPRLKGLVFTGLVGPTVILVVLWQGTSGRMPAGVLLSLGSVAGLGVFGSNAFGVERQALGLLFSFPVARFSVLMAKNLGSMILRLPALALVVAATLVVAGPALLPAVVTVTLLTELLAAGVDNYVSVLAPIPVAAAGGDPNAPTSGTRGLGGALIAFGGMVAALVVSAPFTFLAWLPHLLGAPWLWAATLPLGLAGAAAAYFMLTAGAARLVERREPELVALAAGER